MKNKALTIILFVFFAIPIPFSLVSWIGTIISVANFGMLSFSKFGEVLKGIIALITMLLAGTYLITYIFSIIQTLNNKTISKISFLPLLHIVLFVFSVCVWKWIEIFYK